ncbi:MAG TPA: aminopeptidase [Symbiobacteriaceae bacterium]|nr:aminopeptidase [Symbiobacteriaceae bacterium]
MAGAWADNVLRVCMGLGPGERFVALVDEPLRDAGAALCAAAESLGGRAVSHLVPPDTARLTLVPDSFLRQVATADVVVALLSRLDLGQEHVFLRAGMAAFRSAGKGRWATGAFIDEDVLARELNADYRQVAELTARWAERMARADRVRIVTARGTDLTFRLGGRPVHQDTGQLTAPGAIGNLPAGEAYVAPLEDSASGTLAVDLSVGDILLSEPVRLTFRSGRAVSLSGGPEAQLLERRLGDDPHAWTLGEFGVGTNPAGRIRGHAATDEKVLGTVHIALGGNLSFGGANPAGTHYDCVIGAPRIYLDDVLVEGSSM